MKKTIIKHIVFVCIFALMYHPDINTMKRKTEDITEKTQKNSCSKCNRSFKYLYLLRNHEIIHSENRQYICPKCNKKFVNLSSLNAHKKTHSKVNPYKCNQCSKSFKTNKNLTEHKRTHTKDKPYTCIVCNKNFRMKSHLANHMRIHSGERPYPCTICNKSFKQNSDLKKHLARHPEAAMYVQALKSIPTTPSFVPEKLNLIFDTDNISQTTHDFVIQKSLIGMYKPSCTINELSTYQKLDDTLFLEWINS